MKDRFLPLGTVVLLKGAKRNVMITNYLIYSGKEGASKKVYDYGACPFPEGLMKPDMGIGFNHDDIAEVIYLGLQNDEQKEFNKKLLENEKELIAKFNEATK